MRRSIVPAWLLIGLALLLLVAACGSGEETPSPRTSAPGVTSSPVATAAAPTAALTPTAIRMPTGELRFAVQTIAGFSLLPGVSIGKPHLDPMFDINAALLSNGQLEPKNSTVSSWTASADSKVWTLKFRDGIVFHTGDKATAKDLKFTLDFFKHTGSNATGAGWALRQAATDAITSPDDATVVVTLRTIDIFMPIRFLAHNGYGTTGNYLLPKAYMESMGIDLSAKALDLSQAVKAPVGSGPYKFVSSIVNQEVVMEAVERPHWLYGIPRFKTGKVLIIPEPATRLALLKTGGLEVANIGRSPIPEMKRLGLTSHLQPMGDMRTSSFTISSRRVTRALARIR